MSEQQHPWLEEFISLGWYEAFLRFIANFIAKSSEILLTAGLVVSSANFLSDGSMLKDGTVVAIAWAWTQAIAIDGSLGVSFYSIFQSLKQRDWIKVFLYSILTSLLTLVAWFITEGNIFSHAVNTSSSNAIQLIGIDVRLLSTIRAIAVVGFVLMGRLRDMTLWEHKTTENTSRTTGNSGESLREEQQAQAQKNATVPFTEGNLEKLIYNVLQKRYYNITLIHEEESSSNAIPHPFNQPALPEGTNNNDILQPGDQVQLADQGNQAKSKQEEVTKARDETLLSEDELIGQENRLRQAYQELQKEGKHISGRALAQRAHV